MSDCEHDKRFKSVFFLPKEDHGCVACGFERVSAELESVKELKSMVRAAITDLRLSKNVSGAEIMADKLQEVLDSAQP